MCPSKNIPVREGEVNSKGGGTIESGSGCVCELFVQNVWLCHCQIEGDVRNQFVVLL